MVTDKQQVVAANRLRELLAAYAEVEDLVALGAYKEGSKPASDEAISKWEAINTYLRQDKSEGVEFGSGLETLMEIVNG